MSINLQTGSYPAPQILPGARSTDIQVAQKQQQDPVQQNPEFVLPTPGLVSPEQQRYDQVFFASKALVNTDVFAVSDKSFTIFKDAGGQYVTRYTSLRDGKVTYVPELKLIEFYGAGQPKNQEQLLQLQA